MVHGCHPVITVPVEQEQEVFLSSGGRKDGGKGCPAGIPGGGCRGGAGRGARISGMEGSAEGA